MIMPTKRTERSQRYDSQHTRRFDFKFNLRTDADILKWLENKENFQATMKKLIRSEIEREAGHGIE